MSVETTRAQVVEPLERSDSDEFNDLKDRLDLAQLEQTIFALHQSLPKTKADEAEQTMRRMFQRAKRWSR